MHPKMRKITMVSNGILYEYYLYRGFMLHEWTVDRGRSSIFTNWVPIIAIKAILQFAPEIPKQASICVVCSN